ncbi:POTRA domain-containing protein [Wenyingzhuangia sp. IMCC45574]
MKQLILVLVMFLFMNGFAQKVVKIDFKGNKKTKSEILHKLTRLEVGQELDSIVLQNDAVLLSRLPAFSKASFIVKDNNNGSYDITYKVEETNTIIPSVSFWTAANQQFTYRLGLQEFNFLGENKRIGGFYQNNGFHSFSLNYTDPQLFGNFCGASLTVQSLTTLEPLYFESGSADYEYTNSSIEASVFKLLTVAHKVELGVNLFEEKYQYNNGFQDAGIPTNLEQNKLLFKASFDYNRLQYEYQYVDGFRSLLYAQHVMPIEDGQEKFNIIWNDFYYYKKIKGRGNFASRLRAGFASNDDNPFAPFALDNNLNIRGVGNIIDRGTAVLVLNAEYRHTVLDKKWFAIQTNAFVDAGAWRTAGGELRELFMINRARIHPGVGLRFIHKKIYNAVFRIDYGQSVFEDRNQGGWVFGIGQYF